MTDNKWGQNFNIGDKTTFGRNDINLYGNQDRSFISSGLNLKHNFNDTSSISATWTGSRESTKGHRSRNNNDFKIQFTKNL